MGGLQWCGVQVGRLRRFCCCAGWEECCPLFAHLSKAPLFSPCSFSFCRALVRNIAFFGVEDLDREATLQGDAEEYLRKGCIEVRTATGEMEGERARGRNGGEVQARGRKGQLQHLSESTTIIPRGVLHYHSASR